MWYVNTFTILSLWLHFLPYRLQTVWPPGPLHTLMSWYWWDASLPCNSGPFHYSWFEQWMFSPYYDNRIKFQIDLCLSWYVHSSLSCRRRVAYGMSLSKPTLCLSGANWVHQCLNKLKVRTGWLALKERTAGLVCVVGVAKSQPPQRLSGPQHRTMAPGLCGLL